MFQGIIFFSFDPVLYEECGADEEEQARAAALAQASEILAFIPTNWGWMAKVRVVGRIKLISVIRALDIGKTLRAIAEHPCAASIKVAPQKWNWDAATVFVNDLPFCGLRV